ncbi:hypothetical protein RJ639_009246 [Escallonia herrerae]|uniref:Uncharacterized protein n=1 Tax=Escallonia herrerae TaxID=1293975 RepID=A0AA88VR65_9ASTE|nr:hypothetical protein RJ639_009246 [Escallonia herrerae]
MRLVIYFCWIHFHRQKLLNFSVERRRRFRWDLEVATVMSGGWPICISVSSAVTRSPDPRHGISLLVCDELLLGIPHKAWLVVILVVICLGLAFMIPLFLPSYLLDKSPSPQSVHQIVSKNS